MQVHEKVFPFVCENPDCKKKYDIKRFHNVIKLWGLIYLENDEYSLVGITCPECLKTTLRKYKYPSKFRLEFYYSLFDEERINIITTYQLYSPGILSSLGLISPPKFQKSNNEQRLYKADLIKGLAVDYTKTFQHKGLIPVDEANILIYLNIENEQGLRVFPRVVLDHNFIEQYATLEFDSADKLTHDMVKNIMGNFRMELFRRYHIETDKVKPNIGTASVYDRKINNDMTSGEFDNLHLRSIDYNNLEFRDNLFNLVKEYNLLRNKTDYELNYRNSFLNKHARIFHQLVVGSEEQKGSTSEKKINLLKDYEKLLNEVQRLEEEFPALKDIVACHPDMLELKRDIIAEAKDCVDILITGETGCGKELLPEVIYKASGKKGKLIKKSGADLIGNNMTNSELFGHGKGSFTGADKKRPGAFRTANGGVLFLDEFTTIPIDLHPKLLRVVQNKEIIPVGADEPIKVDVMLVFATNKDIEKEVNAGRFMPDLFYRMPTIPILIPPLRDRRSDIILLADHFRTEANGNFNKLVDGFAPDFIKKIRKHPWKGNVRELQKFIETVVRLSKDVIIEYKNLPEKLKLKEQNDVPKGKEKSASPAKTFSKEELIFWMKKLNNNQLPVETRLPNKLAERVATKLGVHRKTIWKRWNELKAPIPS